MPGSCVVYVLLVKIEGGVLALVLWMRVVVDSVLVVCVYSLNCYFLFFLYWGFLE